MLLARTRWIDTVTTSHNLNGTFLTTSSGFAFRRKWGGAGKDPASRLLRNPSEIRIHREYVKLDTPYGEVLTHLTLNLHYSIGDEGVFLSWLNYVIPPAGSRKAQRARPVKYVCFPLMETVAALT